jgi:hypothetical protein
MNNRENPVAPITDGNTGPSPADGGILCGGTLPPCPDKLVYVERNALIYQIAGTRTDHERVRAAAARVDEYLVGALRSALLLTRPLSERSATVPA